MLVRFLYWVRCCQEMMENHMSYLSGHCREQRALTLILRDDWIFCRIYLDPAGEVPSQQLLFIDGNWSHETCAWEDGNPGLCLAALKDVYLKVSAAAEVLPLLTY